MADPTAVSQLSIVHIATNGEVIEEAESLKSFDRNQTMSYAFSISDKLISRNSDGLQSSENFQTAFNFSNSSICSNSEDTKVPEKMETEVRAPTHHTSFQCLNIASNVSVKNSSPI